MHRLDHNSDTVWFEFSIDCIGNLGRQLLLNLQTPSESLDGAIWCSQWLSKAIVAQHDHLVIKP